MHVGDVQTDIDGSEWVIISVSRMNGQEQPSRVRRNSLAHHVHAQSSPTIAKSLEKEEDGAAATPAESSEATT